MKLRDIINESPDDLLEELASLEHDQWMEWAKSIESEVSEERKERWRRLYIPYSDLPEERKEKDREYARRILAVIRKGKS